MKTNGADAAGQIEFVMNNVFPYLVRFFLFHHRLMVLGVRAINRIFAGTRITVLATSIHEEFGKLEIFVVAGLTIKLEQSDFLAFVFGNVISYAVFCLKKKNFSV